MDADLVNSRFVTQDEVEAQKARREDQWKAAYARLGQEPPPQQQEDQFDGRSLAEKLAANKIAKQEEWEEKTKLANQFRALEEDEIMFLDSLREKQMEEERQRKERDGEEVKNFRHAVAARISAANTVQPSTSQPAVAKPVKKEGKPSLKGIVVKKKAKPGPSTVKAEKKVEAVEKKVDATAKRANATESKDDDAAKADEVTEPKSKRRKVDESS